LKSCDDYFNKETVMFLKNSDQSSSLARRSLLACLAAGLVAPLRAQTKWPNKVLRIVIPFVPGGPPDAVARLILPKLSENLGQSIVIDNRGGAGGNIGTQLVAKLPPDGNTLLLTTTAFVINTQFPESNYNALTDFLPVTITATQSHVIVVHPSLPVKTLAELVTMARTNPMAFATPGSGTAPHLTAERFFNLVAKVNMTPIHYRGAGLAVGAVVAGEPKVGCMAIAGPLQNIKAGKLRALAVSSSQRLATLPDVPTLTELGYADILDSTWVGAFLPNGTPSSIQARWYEALSQVLAMPDIQEKIQSFAFDIIADTPAHTSEYVKEEMQRWGDVIRRTGIKIE
jgi:tripartite-type tricarboxylate transporter receptor subunit TctC